MAGLGSWAIGLVCTGLVVSGAVGCGPGETTDSTGGTGGTGGEGGGPVCPEDPAEGEVPEECGIWVSTSLGNDDNPGTQGAPVASLMHAIELANELAPEGLGRVYACGETWSETLVVPFGVSLFGGFDCEASWAYVGEPKRAMLIAPGSTAVTWVADDPVAMPSTFADFYVESADATEPGGASIALFVRDLRPLLVMRAEFTSGNGADGLDAEEEGEMDPPPKVGEPGNEGADACSASVSAGGVAPELSCPGGPMPSRGGAGGSASPALAEDGKPGEPASDPPGGEGGLGEQSAPACTSGAPGTPGADGQYGKRGVGTGNLTEEGYVGARGFDGLTGRPGQGGGGGGATFGSAAACGAASAGGAAGGSGGTGGCGGKGGRGGSGGGASLPIAIRGDVELRYVLVRPGKGGKGGNGAPPQLGAAGGAGGKGGQGAGAIDPGCGGGSGGTGGKGGWGGGGAGGPALGFGFWAGVGLPAIFEVDYDMSGADGGEGGYGEDPFNFETTGQKGTDADIAPLGG